MKTEPQKILIKNGRLIDPAKGKILWTVFGVLFITLIDNSLNMLGLSYFSIMMAKGAVILLASLAGLHVGAAERQGMA